MSDTQAPLSDLAPRKEFVRNCVVMSLPFADGKQITKPVTTFGQAVAIAHQNGITHFQLGRQERRFAHGESRAESELTLHLHVYLTESGVPVHADKGEQVLVYNPFLEKVLYPPALSDPKDLFAPTAILG